VQGVCLRSALTSESCPHTYLLLATNAAWIASTDDFLKTIEEERPWPPPHLADDQTAGNG
jgi:hypothetical protein